MRLLYIPIQEIIPPPPADANLFGYGEIYCIVNQITGQRYIGQTRCMKRINGNYRYHGYFSRFQQHMSDAFSSDPKRKNNCPKFYSAIRKYGRDFFYVYLLEQCRIEEINRREKYFIRFYQSRKKGYNITTGGQRLRKRRKGFRSSRKV